MVIVVFIGAARFSFETILDAAATARINALARAGTAAVEFGSNGYEVNEVSLGGFSVHSESEGLEWFDLAGRVVARRGQTPLPPGPPHAGSERFKSPGSILDTYTLQLLDQRGVPRGWVRATEVYNPSSDPARALDWGLGAGAVLALLAGAFGGTLLARSSVRRVEEGYERLREFTADASHELRGPLAALAGTASVALREAPDLAPPTRTRLADIAKLSQQMRRLVDDLLIIARADQPMGVELFVIDLGQLMSNLHLRYAQSASEQGLQLAFSEPPAIEMYGNPDQIERIVANLLENAIHYTASGGTVAVSSTVDANRVQIAVRDDGGGIRPDQLERIFDRFWRGEGARRSDGGSGLGLAIARALARRHGGEVSVTSEPGKGSTFTLLLPRRPPALDD